MRQLRPLGQVAADQQFDRPRVREGPLEEGVVHRWSGRGEGRSGPWRAGVPKVDPDCGRFHGGTGLGTRVLRAGPASPGRVPG